MGGVDLLGPSTASLVFATARICGVARCNSGDGLGDAPSLTNGPGIRCIQGTH